MEYAQCSLPLIHSPKLTHKLRLYSLFKRINHQWIRVSDNAYSEKLAYMIFTERLVENPMNFSIRPVKIKSLSAR